MTKYECTGKHVLEKRSWINQNGCGTYDETAFIPAEIGTGHIPDTIEKRYRFNQLTCLPQFFSSIVDNTYLNDSRDITGYHNFS
jgi:hypothetical protein